MKTIYILLSFSIMLIIISGVSRKIMSIFEDNPYIK